MTQDDYSVTGAMIVVATIALLQIATSFLTFKVPSFRRVLEGAPIVIVQDGRLIERNMRRERLTADDVSEEARQDNDHRRLARLRISARASDPPIVTCPSPASPEPPPRKSHLALELLFS